MTSPRAEARTAPLPGPATTKENTVNDDRITCRPLARLTGGRAVTLRQDHGQVPGVLLTDAEPGSLQPTIQPAP
jgi:hypothetical protein